MHKSTFLFPIGLFFGAGLGFLVAASYGVTLDGHDHSEGHDQHGAEASEMDHSKMDHGKAHGEPIIIDEGPTAPTIDIVVKPDAMSGWNLEVVTTNFTFAPNQVNQDNQDGAGHAHVYVNGKKLSRLYAPWMHLGKLPAGETTVSVSLNANDHSPFFVGDAPLSAQTVLQVE